eukprot:5253461-Ditylum_brightwellii.AAC.1
MGGVDVSDQCISYYQPPNIVCQHKVDLGMKALSHNQLTYQMISWLIQRAHEKLIIARAKTSVPPSVVPIAP